MTTATCDLCTRPVDGTAYACTACTATAGEQLATVTTLAAEIETTVARLARHTDRGGRRLAPADTDDEAARADGGLRPTPLPYAPEARNLANAAANTIVTWARHVAETRGAGPLRPQPMTGPLCHAGVGCRHDSCTLIRARTIPHGVARAATYLLGNLGWLRHRQEAREALNDLTDAARTIARVVDAPPPLWYAGPCWTRVGDGSVCDEELYAHAGAGTVRCPGCRTTHETVTRRTWLLGEAEDVLAHAALIAAALTALDRPVTSSMIRNLAHRRRLAERGRDGRDRPLYRVGDVLALRDEIDRRDRRVAA